MGEILSLARTSLRKQLGRARFFAALLLTAGCVVMGYFHTPDYLAGRNLTMQAGEPFLLMVGAVLVQLLLLLSFLLLLGDAPFFHEGMEIVVMRSSKRKWIAAQIVACVVTTILWLLFLFAFTLLYFNRHLSFANEWSKVAKMARRSISGGAPAGFQLGVAPSAKMAMGTKPYAMFGLSFLLNSLLYVCLALWGMTLNLWLRRSYGSLFVISLWGLRFGLQVLELPSLGRVEILNWISPMGLVDVTAGSFSGEKIAYIVLFFLFQIVLLATFSRLRLRRMDMTKLG